MALLDVFRNIGEKMGRGMERNIGGLLGVAPEDMTEEERKQARRLSQMAVFDALAKGTTPTAGLQGAAELLGAQREKRAVKKRQEEAQQEIGRIAGRLYGGAPAATMPEQAADGLTGVNIQSQYRVDPQDALRRMYSTPAGMDASTMAPGLLKSAEEAAGPKDYIYQNVSGVGLVAVNRKDPSDTFVVKSEVQRAGPGRDRIKILSAAEARALGLPPTRVYKQNLTTGDVSAVEGSETKAPGVLSADDEEKYQKAKGDLKNARALIQNLRQVSAEVPAYKALAGEGAGRLESSYSLALSAIRQLQNSGVLNVGELPFLSKALSDPTTLSSILTSPLQRRKLDGQISTVLGLLDSQQAVLDERFGKTPPVAPQKSAGSPAASGYRRGRKPDAPGADAVKRAEGYY